MAAKGTTGTTMLIFGYIGYEQEINSHIKTRIMFAITDMERTRLAWYLFSQSMLVHDWEAGFSLASVGDRKLERNETFGEAVTASPSPFQCDFRTQVDKLAPAILRSDGGWATLDMNDDAATGLTGCMVYVDLQPSGVILPFDLKTVGRRRTLNIKKKGRVYLLGVERYSHHAFERGPTKAVTKMDPYIPSCDVDRLRNNLILPESRVRCSRTAKDRRGGWRRAWSRPRPWSWS